MRLGPALQVVAAGLACAASAGASGPRHDFRLENGLHVVLVEDHSRPRVAVSVGYGAGVRDEPEGYSGLAHLTEHLMFHGSRHVPADGVMPALERAGATKIMGETRLDAALYSEEMPSRSYEVALWVESDRMAFMLDTLTPAVVDREIEIVGDELSERGFVAWLQTAVTERMFPSSHPYHRSSEGLRGVGLQDVQYFFQTRYRPDNATLALVGDFDPAAAEQSVRRYFGPIVSAGPRVGRRPAALPDVEGGRESVKIQWDVSALIVGWALPLDDRGRAALALVADCISRPGSFLQETLLGHPIGGVQIFVEQADVGRGAVFLLGSAFAKGHDPAKVLRTLDVELGSVASNPSGNCNRDMLVSRRLQRRLAALSFWSVSRELALGGPLPEDAVGVLESVTDEDIRAVAEALRDRARFVFEVR